MRLVECLRCKSKGTFRFCTDGCFIDYAKDPKRKFVECAICQYDPVTGRIGNVRTHRLCTDCKQGAENKAWKEPSEQEQGTDDIDAAVAISGAGVRIEALAGGKRKADTELADRVINIARTAMVPRRRRKRSAAGKITRGFETVMVPPNEREIAEMAGCSQTYVRKLLKRVLG